MKNIDVVLVMAPSPNPGLLFAFEHQGMPPLGLGYLATELNKYGYGVKIIDMARKDKTMKDLFEVLDVNSVGLVGISATTEAYNSAIRIAEAVKSYSDDIIVTMGGPHVTFEYEQALKSGFVDFVCHGEGEIAMRKLCDVVLKESLPYEDLRSISYIHKGEIVTTEREPLIEDLDALGFPDRTHFDDLESYAHPSNCSTSRGCPGKCIFCAASGLSGNRYRMRSAKSIVSEFAYLKSLGYSHVDIIDDTMTASIRRLNAFIDELNKQDLGMTWYCESRVDVMTKDLLTKMRDAGCTLLQFGVEAGSQEMLDCLKKNITMEQILNVFKWCGELEIKTSTNLIIGQPFDTDKTIADTLNIAKQIAELGAAVNFTVSTPYPGTDIWNFKEKYGLEIIQDNLDFYTTFCPVYNTKYLNHREIRNYYAKAISMIRGFSNDKNSEMYSKMIRRTVQGGERLLQHAQ